MINLHGKQVYPLVTGTFGGVDFLHSVLGEATDHVTQTEVDQSEVDQLNAALSQAQQGSGKRGFGDDTSSNASGLTDLLSQIPGTGDLVQEAMNLQADSQRQEEANQSMSGSRGYAESYQPYGNEYGSARAPDGQSFQAPPGSQGGPPGPGIPGVNMNVDPAEVVKKIYPLLAFRDKVVRNISAIVSKIPGLEKMIDTISEKVTLFIMGLLAPYIKPVIAAASNALKTGSGTVVSASQKQQYLVWEDPTSSDPTHSLLSKDHFSNILNEPAGQVAAEILQYVAPRVIYGWEHPEVPEHEIMDDVTRVFHHPAIRDQNCELHRIMFGVVEKWVQGRSDRGSNLDQLLSSESVKAGRNHKVQNFQQSLTGLEGAMQGLTGGTSSHSSTSGGPFAMLQGRRELGGEERDLAYGSSYQTQDYAQSSYEQRPPQPAGYAPQDHNAFPSAYQQGYDAPYERTQQQEYGQQEYGQQGGYGGYNNEQNQGGYGQQGGYGRY
nr:hypothetical protein CFP56_26013 [Quercus suber]